MVGETLGHYQITAELGRGGMGEVYRAFDVKLRRPVAVKILRDEGPADRFVREAQAASALNHPNIVTIHGIGETDVAKYIVMELIEGETLRQYASDNPQPDALTRLTAQVARALDAAHSAGIVHRDIKPENIMVRPDGYVKVLDFGLARMLDGAPDEGQTQTIEGSLVGTIGYMSPEQVRGEPVDGGTDIFSLGVVLYELVTGRHPFHAESKIGTMHSILADAPLAPSCLNSEVPESLERLLMRMLEKDRRLRPSAHETETALCEPTRSVVAFRAAPVARCTVGREKERAEMQGAFQSALGGHGSVMVVAGEPGMGKTALVEDFLAELEGGEGAWIARGRCSERLAGTEAYLPVLEALESLMRGPGGEIATRLMKLLAPTWYAQISPLSAEAASPEHRAASQERLKRELMALLHQLGSSRALAFFLDDLHWADVSTVDLLSYVGGRCESLRALFIATYRPSDLLRARHPFLGVKLELQSHGACREIALEFLALEDVRQYLVLHFPGNRFPPGSAERLHAKTEGNPLFMADLLRYLRDRGIVAQRDGCWALTRTLPEIESELPESVRSMVQRKIEELSEPDRQLLTGAAVQGIAFDSAVIARALALDAAEVEERLEALDRVHAFVRLTAERELPDRTISLRYRFVHVLYQNALYAALRPARRSSLAKGVAQALEAFHAEQAATLASELALLFETARDFSRAADYFLMAARNAARVFANAEALTLARHALRLLQKLPPTLQRHQRELDVQIMLGVSLTALQGYGIAEAEKVYQRARELCELLGANPALLPALSGLGAFYFFRAQLETAPKLARQALEVAEAPWQRSWGHFLLGTVLGHIGEIENAHDHLKKAVELYDPGHHHAYVSQYGVDAGVAALAQAGRLYCVSGELRRGLESVEEALQMARKLAHPYSTAFALFFFAMVHQMRGERRQSRERAEPAMALSSEYGFGLLSAWAGLLRAWSVADVEAIRAKLAELRAIGCEVLRPHFLALLAELHSEAGHPELSLAVLDEAIATSQATGERYYEPELIRRRAELRLAAKGVA